MAIGQNIGTTITALLPALFAYVAPPGSHDVPLIIGTITFAITIVAAVTAWSARENFRVKLSDLGERNAVPIEKHAYEALRAQTMAEAKKALA
jgi:hypothetical protein